MSVWSDLLTVAGATVGAYVAQRRNLGHVREVVRAEVGGRLRRIEKRLGIQAMEPEGESVNTGPVSHG